jgi:hypothetical protein
MSLVQLVYASQPFGFDSAMLNGILVTSRANNVRDQITGALICRADIYLQHLEGPSDKVEAAYRRILRDDRHLDARLLLNTPVEDRLFPEWAMRDDPARSWMWTQEEVDAGAPGRATPDEVRAIFVRLASELD